MTFEFLYPKGATPLERDYISGLIPKLSTQAQLNEFEQMNISKANQWAIKSRILKRELLSIHGIKRLHKKMFDLTWKWAGEFRTLDMNIGVQWMILNQQLKILFDDIEYWINHSTYPLTEIAVRFHHKLVFIHPFPNGNGRCSRLAADLFLQYRGEEPLVWGHTIDGLTSTSEARAEYLAALKEADQAKYEKLIKFATYTK